MREAPNVSDWRIGGANACGAMKVEYGTSNANQHKRRSWSCQLVEGHEGRHASASGHRMWEDSDTITHLDQELKTALRIMEWMVVCLDDAFAGSCPSHVEFEESCSHCGWQHWLHGG